MTFLETKKILMAVVAVYGPDRFKFDHHATRVWHALCKDFHYNEFSAALKSYVENETWPPTPAHLIRQVRANLSTGLLTDHPDDATEDHPLYESCKNFADRATKALSPHGTQYSSIEELDRAKRIYSVTWRREFNQRFTEKQVAARRRIEEFGATEQQAIDHVLQRTSEPVNALGQSRVNEILQIAVSKEQ